MLRLINGVDIECTKGDTFDMKVSSKAGFNENSQLRLVVTRDEYSLNIIDHTYELQDGSFNVTLNEQEREKLDIGEYIYKLTLLTPDGAVVTQKSGNFKVKWGA